MINKLHAWTQMIVIPRYMKNRQQWLSLTIKGFVWLLEDTHLGPMQKLKMEVKFFTSM